MSEGLYDEDGIDGPFERRMKAAMREDARQITGAGAPRQRRREMPHDRNGQPVKVGDTVRVDFTVTQVYQTEGDSYCNAQLETVLPMYPGEHRTGLTVNTKQTEVVEPTGSTPDVT